MLLNELANSSEVEAAGKAIKSLWTFKAPFVDPKRSNNGKTTVQFRLSAEADAADLGYNSLDHDKLDDKLKNALHNAGVKFTDAGFEEIERNFNAAPVISYTVVF